MAPYCESQRRSIYRYRQKNQEHVKAKQKEYSQKYYENNKTKQIANIKFKRECVRLAGLGDIYLAEI
jgi:lipopolysaccharide export LptBFGC system permease protein LptF